MSRPGTGSALAAMTIAGLALLGCGQSTTEKPPVTAAAGVEANVVVCAPGSFMSGNECIPAKPDCPPGTTPREGQCAPEKATPEPAVAVDERPPSKGADSTKSLEEMIDPRRGRLQPRARQLLITEVQGLEALFQASPKDGADRPALMRRMAETYVELSASAKRDGETGAGEPEKMKKIETASRTAAIKYYAQLLQQYPKWCATVNKADPGRSAGCADEPQYYMSLEYRRSGELDKARKSLLQLVQNYPQSSFIAHAYYQFGEMFMDDAQSDPSKWVFAEQSFLEASKYPASSIAPAALFRLGQTYEQMKDAAKARSAYKRLIRDFPSSPLVKEVPAGMQ